MLSWWKKAAPLCGSSSSNPFLFTFGLGVRLPLQRSDWVWVRLRRRLCKKPGVVFKDKGCIIPKKDARRRRQRFDNQLLHGSERPSIFFKSRAQLSHKHTHTHCPMGVQPAPLLLALQVKRPTPKGHMTQPLAFLPILLCISGVHETLRHPPLLSLAHARLLVAVAESRACQEPCLGATRIDKMRMRARDWHMVLISSPVYQGPLTTK